MTPLDLYVEHTGEVFTADAAGALAGAVVGVVDDRIVYVGAPEGLAAVGYAVTPTTRRLDARGGLVTPGLIDPHTHLVFSGDRAEEYALRTAGATYRDLARSGGGIASTMRATRAASLDALVAASRPRLDRLLAHGVTTAEVKSGYGLDLETELKLLRAIRVLDAGHPIELVSTYLGAHTVPPEHRDAPEAYFDLIVREVLPAVHREGLATFCDAFVEETAIPAEAAERILRAAQRLGLRSKLHVDQLADADGAALAARLGAVSADHLEHTSPSGIEALARAGTTAVLLPGATLFLGQAVRPPARALVSAGVPVALSTDCNPGTCPTENLPLMLTLGMSLLGLSPTEVLLAVTTHAARAVGLEARLGRLVPGLAADLVVFDVPDHVRLPYAFGVNRVRTVVKSGRVVLEREAWPNSSSPT